MVLIQYKSFYFLQQRCKYRQVVYYTQHYCINHWKNELDGFFEGIIL
jgi:hypothetical protein